MEALLLQKMRSNGLLVTSDYENTQNWIYRNNLFYSLGEPQGKKLHEILDAMQKKQRYMIRVFCDGEPALMITETGITVFV